MTMSSRIAVMNNGQIVQTGTPAEIYEYPQSRYVSEFIGQINTFEGRIAEDETDHVVIDSAEAGCELYIDHSVPGIVGQQVWVAVRPEKMTIHREPQPTGRNCVHGRVEEIAYLGNFSTYVVQIDSGREVRVVTPNLTRMVDLPITWEDEVWVTWEPNAGVVLNA